MKKIFLGACLLVLTVFANAQIKGILDRAKQKTANKANEKVNKKADNTVDSAFTKKEKPVTDPVKDTPDTPVEKTEAPVKAKTDSINPASTSIKAYSKYDFVPGEKVMGFEDFSTGNIGDFPAGWNTTGSGEIVTIEGKPGRWLWLTKPGVFVPEFTERYPDDFTFEFDLLHGIPMNGGQFKIAFSELANINQPQHWSLGNNVISFDLNAANSNASPETGLSRYSLRKNAATDASNQLNTSLLSGKNNPVHISIWRQKERVRVYLNQEKIWDIPKGLTKETKLNAIVFSVIYAEATVQHYIGNLRLAVGAPDTRNKMLTQNKWVTHGILFDVNSANIKPESYGTLKEIANVLKENPDLKVNIVGHTDADGADAANLDLSKRRSASVKAALAKEFAIDESRMETDGKGESEPIDKNDKPAGKANNRRVEFIKI